MCVALAALSLFHWSEPGSRLRMSGSALYLAGTLFATMAFNVPLNDALARVDPASDEGARVWNGYVDRWTAWNHVRTAAAATASALFILAR